MMYVDRLPPSCVVARVGELYRVSIFYDTPLAITWYKPVDKHRLSRIAFAINVQSY